MASGTAKLQLLIELKNKLKAGLDGAKKQVNKACGDMQNRLNSFKAGNIKAFEAIKSEVPAVGRALSMLANPYVAATVAVLALGAGIVKCTNMANEWHKQMAEINVTAELSKKELGKLSDKLLEIGGRNAAPLEEVPKAFNRIISAGLSVNDSLATLEPTLRAAKAGFTDIETVASAAVSVMMSSGESATKVYDVLFETVKEGNAEFKDIAQYLPKIIPLARNVGFALDETAGAYASLTGKLSAEQSTTALQGIMRALSDQRIAIGEIDKKTGKYVKGFKAIGVEVFDPATKKIRPLLDIITDISKKMEGLSDKERMLKFDKLGLDQMGTLGFSTLMQDIEGLAKATNATANSAGALEKAYTDSLTPMESWKIVQNQLKVQMIKIGELFLPIISMIGQKILDVINYFKNLYKESALLRDILSLIGTVFKVAFAIAIAPVRFIINLIRNLWEAIKWVGNALGGLVIKVLGIKKPFSELYSFIRPYLIWIKEFVGSIGELLYDVFTFNFKGAKDKIKNFKMPDLKDIRIKLKKEVEADNPDGDFNGVPDSTDSPNENNGDNGSKDAKSISGGSQSKNITINIDSFIKGFSPTHQSINGMNKDELERYMTEMFMRVVRSAETAI